MKYRKTRMDVKLHDTLVEIRKRVGKNAATSYTKDGCSVSMANIPSERALLDVDLAFPPDRTERNQCDYILFYVDTNQDCLIGVPMELKSGDVKASNVVAQLQEGAKIVDDFTPRNIDIELISILVHDGIHKAQSERLKISRIRFRGSRIPINRTTCGYTGNIAEALRKSTRR